MACKTAKLAVCLALGLMWAPAARAQTPLAPGAAAAPPKPAAEHTPAAANPVKEPPLGFDPDEIRGAETTSAAEGLSGAWAMMVKAFVGLAAVLMLIYLFVGKGLQKLAQRQSIGRSMRVIDRVGLDPKKTLYLVDVDGVRTLVGISETSMSMMVMPEPMGDTRGPSPFSPPAAADGGAAPPKGEA